VVQLFLSSNRSWRSPVLTEEFLADVAGFSGGVYVHAPYLVNPASADPLVRSRSRESLKEQFAAAERIGALGVVVHGGHLAGPGGFADGVHNWLEVLSGWDSTVPLLVENTAGGTSALARSFSDFQRLFDALVGSGRHVGVCIDTCHAWAGGEPLAGAVERVRGFAGAVDLLHVNDSLDDFDSSRDRHANLGSGRIPVNEVLEVVSQAACDAVVETPNGPLAMARDLAFLRENLLC